MLAHYTLLNLFTLLLVSAIALPHDENSTAVAAAKITRIDVYTVMQTTAKESVVLLPTDSSLTCPTPETACIIDGIPIWPTSSPATAATSTLETTTSSSATFVHEPVTSSEGESASTPSTSKDTCSYPSSHVAPSKSTSWTTTITTPIDHSSTLTPTPIDDATTPPISDEPTAFSANMADQTTDANAPTSTFDAIAWAGLNKRSEKKSGAQRIHKTFWPRWFVAGYPQTPVQIIRVDEEKDRDDLDDFSSGNEPEGMCVQCEKGRDLVCIGETHFGYCDEGCAEPRRLMVGTKCVDGRIYGSRTYSG